MKRKGNRFLLELTWEQFDKLEEAADIMAMGQFYVDTMEQALEFLAHRYILEEGPKYEAKWYDDEELEQPVQ